MRLWLRLAVAIIIVLSVVFASVVWFGTARWNGATDELVAKLGRSPHEPGAGMVSFKEFGNLPAPVARYFRMALTEGQPLVRKARVMHRGVFLTDTEKNDWKSFASTQHFFVDPPGFVWDAAISMAPLMKVRVRDSYAAGQGMMEASILAVVPVLGEEGKTELSIAALQRYLAEAVWFPTALLPDAGVQWISLDSAKASATITDSGTTVSLEFTFNDAGEITVISSPGRYREVNGTYELTPWVIHVGSYEMRDGMMIPLEGEVAWQLPGGAQPYWKGRVVDVRYEFAR